MTNTFLELVQSIALPNKYTKWYCQIVNKSQNRAKTRKQAKLITREEIEKHHIIPECFFLNRKRKGHIGWLPGDSGGAENFAFLTTREHFICHWLLSKMFGGKLRQKMLKALCGMLMRNKNQNTRYYTKITGRVYAKIKAEVKQINASNVKNTSPAKIVLTGEKIGRVTLNDPRWITGEIVGLNKGKKFPDMWTEERKLEQSNNNKGRSSYIRTAEQNANNSARQKGKKTGPRSEKDKQKMRKPKGPQTKLSCPYCPKEGEQV